ncbi:MAG: 50S ribosomal protein L5 [Candidatus Omnitrophica bacterium]|nr:50S ribosomal protein L5 [Candidatus Omnitrophota bacterium]
MKKSRLLEKYSRDIIPEMMKKFGYKNRFQTPKIKKIVINSGLGEGSKEFKIIEKAMEELAQIAGQKPVITRAKKAISNFKIRAGDAVGCKVTLRGSRMYDFLDRFINVAIPRIKDFRGINPKSFDSSHNFTVGIKEQSMFPEIDYDRIDRTIGMNITFDISSQSREESHELLKLFGMPYKK